MHITRNTQVNYAAAYGNVRTFSIPLQDVCFFMFCNSFREPHNWYACCHHCSNSRCYLRPYTYVCEGSAFTAQATGMHFLKTGWPLRYVTTHAHTLHTFGMLFLCQSHLNAIDDLQLKLWVSSHTPFQHCTSLLKLLFIEDGRVAFTYENNQ